MVEHDTRLLIHQMTYYDYFESFFCGDVEVMLIPAGHITGSAMTLMIYQGKRILYTGDFSYPLSENDLENELAKEFLKSIDILIIENTYGHSKNKNYFLSNHANFKVLMDLIKIAYPYQIFLVHQQKKNTWSLKDEIEKFFPSIKIISTNNNEIYNLEGII